MALADQVAGHALGNINPTLYELSAAKAPGVVPVTSGNNTVTFVQNKKTYTIKGFPARAGLQPRRRRRHRQRLVPGLRAGGEEAAEVTPAGAEARWPGGRFRQGQRAVLRVTRGAG